MVSRKSNIRLGNNILSNHKGWRDDSAFRKQHSLGPAILQPALVLPKLEVKSENIIIRGNEIPTNQ